MRVNDLTLSVLQQQAEATMQDEEEAEAEDDKEECAAGTHGQTHPALMSEGQ